MNHNELRRMMICKGCRKGCRVDLQKGSCPLGRWPESTEHTLKPLSPLEIGSNVPYVQKESFGPPMWRLLHETAKAGGLNQEWLDRFARLLPCGDCRVHWKALLERIPPRYGDQWLWSVEVHNAVNARLGKPQWTPPLPV